MLHLVSAFVLCLALFNPSSATAEDSWLFNEHVPDAPQPKGGVSKAYGIVDGTWTDKTARTTKKGSAAMAENTVSAISRECYACAAVGYTVLLLHKATYSAYLMLSEAMKPFLWIAFGLVSMATAVGMMFFGGTKELLGKYGKKVVWTFVAAGLLSSPAIVFGASTLLMGVGTEFGTQLMDTAAGLGNPNEPLLAEKPANCGKLHFPADLKNGTPHAREVAHIVSEASCNLYRTQQLHAAGMSVGWSIASNVKFGITDLLGGNLLQFFLGLILVVLYGLGLLTFPFVYIGGFMTAGVLASFLPVLIVSALFDRSREWAWKAFDSVIQLCVRLAAVGLVFGVGSALLSYFPWLVDAGAANVAAADIETALSYSDSITMRDAAWWYLMFVSIFILLAGRYIDHLVKGVFGFDEGPSMAGQAQQAMLQAANTTANVVSVGANLAVKGTRAAASVKNRLGRQSINGAE